MTQFPSTSRPYDWLLLFAAWLLAAASSLGALFFGEVLGYAPCTLCWYQRIAMFPLAIMLPLALFPLDLRVVRYALPLAAGGLLLAGYHWLLQLGIIAETASPCFKGSNCAEVSVSWFGFVTLPLLSLLAFSLITICLVALRIRPKP
ncbi:disulfide bond formation protein B [Chitinilyticum piscinae]|uniref:Disulfide bond formation protein B n=1 Tax=Chitinilyticum piscinae TaxID=2866724 RepID=A0A8J7FHL1_9NEIS|nr:disulfide bond formation protein B [Chitinilyticum piscinae]MBE9607907.1 disulfide bond formation protein B [Chitinilyticum piscinae]